MHHFITSKQSASRMHLHKSEKAGRELSAKQRVLNIRVLMGIWFALRKTVTAHWLLTLKR